MALRALRDPDSRLRIATRAFDLIQKDFPLEATGQKWISLFTALQATKHPVQVDRPRSFFADMKLESDLIIRAKVRHGRDAFNHFRYLPAAMDFSVATLRLLLHPTLLQAYFVPMTRATSRVEELARRRISTRFGTTLGRRQSPWRK